MRARGDDAVPRHYFRLPRLLLAGACGAHRAGYQQYRVRLPRHVAAHVPLAQGVREPALYALRAQPARPADVPRRLPARGRLAVAVCAGAPRAVLDEAGQDGEVGQRHRGLRRRHAGVNMEYKHRCDVPQRNECVVMVTTLCDLRQQNDCVVIVTPLCDLPQRNECVVIVTPLCELPQRNECVVIVTPLCELPQQNECVVIVTPLCELPQLNDECNVVASTPKLKSWPQTKQGKG